MSDQATDGGTPPQSPEALAEEIERTRNELGETVEALVAKTDVKARAQRRAAEVAGTLRGKARAAQAKASNGSSVYAPAVVAVTAALIGVWLIMRGRRR